MRQAIALTASGIVIGLGASLALTPVVESLLVGVSSTDPFTFVGIPVVLLSSGVDATCEDAGRQ